MLTAALITLIVVPVLIGVHGYIKFERNQRQYEDDYRVRRTVERSPGTTLTLRNPRVHVRRTQLRLIGNAHVSGHDLDGNTLESYTARIDVIVPVTRGISAAADVDGVDTVTITVSGGEVDVIDVRYKCGLRMSVQHFPTAEITRVDA